jgi:hypothetical protein
VKSVIEVDAGRLSLVWRSREIADLSLNSLVKANDRQK